MWAATSAHNFFTLAHDFLQAWWQLTLPNQPADRPQPELLAPAGGWDALRAAVAGGADAVYFGLSNFNARHRANNFTVEELPRVVEYLHRRNVLGYVTVNTLIFSDELAEAEALIAAIVAAGADAVIVQDLGLLRLIRRIAPELPVHGSTQMTLTEPRGIEFVRALGVERVILARELSLDDIRLITTRTNMPLEVFVHGALCIAYSGQCLTSEALGGRSANRGQCAQACRLPYELIVDGETRELADKAYLLSPQDLAAYESIESLVALGVKCFKIEGRLKTPQYVAVTSQTYRAAIDAASAHEPLVLPRQQLLDLEQSFSRGFSPGFVEGVNHQQLVEGRFPKSRGVRLGTVVEMSRGLVLELAAEHAAEDPLPVKPGDGVVLDEGHPEQDEQGGRVFSVTPRPGRRVELGFERGHLDFGTIKLGAIVWKTDDPALRRRTEQLYARDGCPRPRRLDFELSGAIGGSVSLTAVDANGRRATADWPGPLARATNQPITLAAAREQLGRLGDTPFLLGEVKLDLPADAMLPKSVLNALRRQVVAELFDGSVHARIHCDAAEAELRGEIASPPSDRPDEQRPANAPSPLTGEGRGEGDGVSLGATTPHPQPLSHKGRGEQRGSATERGENGDGASNASNLYVLVRTQEQLEAMLRWEPAEPLSRPALVYCDFEDVRRYNDAVALAHDAGRPIGLATLRVLKPGEEGLLARVAQSGADAVLIRNLAGLVYVQERSPQTELIGDFSLNVANELAAELFFRENMARLVPSYDLNWEQLQAMLGRSNPARFEVVVHQHMPMFHMEHCVFAALLSEGKDWRDCGRPCDRHEVGLRDRTGEIFPLTADTGCRNTVFNSTPQSAAEFIPRMQAAGLRHFRLELLRESGAEAIALAERYARVLAGIETGRNAWRQLRVLNQLGVTRGTLQLS